MSKFVYSAELISQSREDNVLRLSLRIPENLYYFQGHFDLAPVLPGVVQTDWVMQYLVEHFEQEILNFSHLANLKFQQIVAPGYQLTLEIKQLDTHKFSFSYFSEHGQHASGKVHFK